MADSSTNTSPERPREKAEASPKIGIALGAGGAKGIANIPMLEALDELGVTPHRIAGSSIGAVIGALYATGLSAQQIKEKVANLAITKKDTVRSVLSNRKISRWMEMIDTDFRQSGLFRISTSSPNCAASGLWSSTRRMRFTDRRNRPRRS